MIDLQNKRIIDLTHSINNNIPSWPTEKDNSEINFSSKIISTYEKGGFFARTLSMSEHSGTHLDAPAHYFKRKFTTDQIPAEKFFSQATVIDSRNNSESNPDYLLSLDDIAKWEERNGIIPSDSVILMLSGWSKYWKDRKRYLNQDKNGTMHFPGFSKEAVEFLIDKRNINGIGVETLSIDSGNTLDFPAHKVLFNANKYALENLTNIDKLPAKGALLIVAPLIIEGGSGSPVRVFAII